MPIFTARTISGRTRQVIYRMVPKVKEKDLDIYSVMKPRTMKGYFFLEAATRDDAKQSIHGLKNARGIVEGEVDMGEIKKFMKPVKETIEIKEGDKVELISGPFQGNKAKVEKVDKEKEEVTVELLEAAVPIPVTVSLGSVKVIGRK